MAVFGGFVGVFARLSGVCYRHLCPSIRPSLIRLLPANVKDARGLASGTPNLPTGPKKPLSAYLDWYLEKRPSLVKNNPGVPLTELSKLGGTMWRNLKLTEKQPYLDKSRKLMDEYKKKHTEFLDSLSEENKQKLNDNTKENRFRRAALRVKRLKTKYGKPRKGPSSSFACFVKAKYASGQEKGNLIRALSNLAAEWRSMSNEQKEPFIEIARKNRLQYERKLTVWEAELIRKGHVDLVRVHSRPRIPVKRVARRATKASALTGFKTKTDATPKSKSGKRKSKTKKQMESSDSEE